MSVSHFPVTAREEEMHSDVARKKSSLKLKLEKYHNNTRKIFSPKSILFSSYFPLLLPRRLSCNVLVDVLIILVIPYRGKVLMSE